jgi:hypothetical protein
MQNSESSVPATFRTFIYGLLDNLFAFDTHANTLEAELLKEWEALQEKCYQSLIALFSGTPAVAITWLIVKFLITPEQKLYGFSLMALLLVIIGYALVLWNAIALVRCGLFHFRLYGN